MARIKINFTNADAEILAGLLETPENNIRVKGSDHLKYVFVSE